MFLFVLRLVSWVERMVVEMMYCQDVENGVADYVRVSGGRVVGYGVDAIVDCLVVIVLRLWFL